MYLAEALNYVHRPAIVATHIPREVALSDKSDTE